MPEHIDHVRQMQSNTVDGTLSEVLQLPVTSWRLVNSLNPLRGRRQVIYIYKYLNGIEILFDCNCLGDRHQTRHNFRKC